MKLIINNSSMQPIYEQICTQIKNKILSGELKQEGFIVTVHGKGSFVSGVNQELRMEEKRKEVETDLEQAIRKARSCGMTEAEIRELFELILED